MIDLRWVFFAIRAFESKAFDSKAFESKVFESASISKLCTLKESLIRARTSLEKDLSKVGIP
jgi:hypothetical protein